MGNGSRPTLMPVACPASHHRSPDLNASCASPTTAARSSRLFCWPSPYRFIPAVPSPMPTAWSSSGRKTSSAAFSWRKSSTVRTIPAGRGAVGHAGGSVQKYCGAEQGAQGLRDWYHKHVMRDDRTWMGLAGEMDQRPASPARVRLHVTWIADPRIFNPCWQEVWCVGFPMGKTERP